MRTTTRLTLLAATALIGLGVAGPAPAATPAAPPTAPSTPASADEEPETARERGIVLECAGRLGGRRVYAMLYENNLHGSTIQVEIGGGDDQVGGMRQGTDDFLADGEVHGRVRVGDRRAVVSGAAARVGKRVPVHEEIDDAGYSITVDGFHRRLRTDLALAWGRHSTDLQCGDAFAYDLQVTKVPVADGLAQREG